MKRTGIENDEYMLLLIAKARSWREKTLLLREAIRCQQKGMARLKKRIVALQCVAFDTEAFAKANPSLTYLEVKAKVEEKRLNLAIERAEKRLEKVMA